MQAAHYMNAFIWKRGCVLIYFMKYITNTRGELMAKQFDGSLGARQEGRNSRTGRCAKRAHAAGVFIYTTHAGERRNEHVCL